MRLIIILYVVLCVVLYSSTENFEIIEFNNCNFIESKFELKCIKYGTYNVTRERSSSEEKMLRIETVFKVKKIDILPVKKFEWTITIEEVTFQIDKRPPSAVFSEQILLPSEIQSFLSKASEMSASSATVNFKSPAVLNIQVSCDPFPPHLSGSCKYNNNPYIVSFNTTKELSANNIKNVYLNNMNESITYLKITFDTEDWSSFIPDKLENIKYLNISYKNVDDGIVPFVFQNMTTLTHLYMTNCNITDIDPKNFMNLPNLKVLDLANNQLSRIPPGIRQLKNLRNLNLSGQRAPEFDLNFNEFKTLAHLEKLNLSRLAIKDLPNSMFCSLVALEDLDLEDCKLHLLPELVFCKLEHLKIVNLANNFLSHLPKMTFRDLAPGAEIKLNRNNLPSHLNLEVNNVSILDLSLNMIDSPTNLIRSGTVIFLDLSTNNITKWTSIHTFISDDHDISNVNLSSNNIATFDQPMTDSMMGMQSVDIGGNPIDCSLCSTKHFQDFVTSNSLQLLIKGEKGPLTCSKPPRLSGISILESDEDLSTCDANGSALTLALSVPIGILIILVSLSGVSVYYYRFELLYIRHLWRMKRRSEQLERVEGCDYDVFVSYSGKDRDWVMDVLLPGLENPTDRYCLCLHERDFRLGTYIMDNVVNCIDSSRRVLLVLTNNYIQSEWCKWELRMAQHRVFEDSGRDFLILLEKERLDRDKLPLSLRVLMGTRTYLEWSSSVHDEKFGQAAFWSRLKNTLGTPLNVTMEDQWQKIKDSDPDGESVSEMYNCSEMLAPVVINQIVTLELPAVVQT